MKFTIHLCIPLLSVATHGFGQSGLPDPRFSVNLGSPSERPMVIHAIAVQSDGRILIGGRFESVDGRPAFRIARLNPDGSGDQSFPFVDPDNEVRAIALQADGKIVFCGTFTNVSGFERLRVARLLSDGQLDGSFAPRLNNWPNTMVALGDQIIIGGSFSQVNDVFRYRIAKINANGTLDETFAPLERSGTCNALAVAGTKVLAAGQFQEMLGEPPYSIVLLNENGSRDEAFFRDVPGFNATALAIQPDGKILVHANSEAMRLNADGTLDESFQREPGPSSHIYSIAVQPDGKIIMAGRFTSYHGVPANHVVRLNTNGTVETTFTASVNTNINTIALQPDGRILIGGEFSSVNGEPRTRIARLLGDNPVLASAKSGPNMVLSWPSVYTNYTLEAATALPSTQWITLSTSPVAVNNEWAITNAISRGNRFFRLSKP